MIQHTLSFTHATTEIYFDASLSLLQQLAPPHNSFIITDEHLMLHYQHIFKPWSVIAIPPGESSKSLEVLDDIIRQLIALEAGRDATIIGIGGGVITDIAGFAAGIYKRGIRCGFVPTSVLGMVDAAVGGKNGLDTGDYKNMIGLTRQPGFLLYDYSLLDTLPEEEWINGFAEIIKHACINDSDMFSMLQQHRLEIFREDKALLGELIRRNVLLKAGYVVKDELETGIRKELNFGHTFAHAIENIYQLPHGHAVAIGMIVAAGLSERETGFRQADILTELLAQYQLPVNLSFDSDRIYQLMLADKKRNGNAISYVLLEHIGKAVVKEIGVKDIKAGLQKQEEIWK